MKFNERFKQFQSVLSITCAVQNVHFSPALMLQTQLLHYHLKTLFQQRLRIILRPPTSQTSNVQFKPT